ncbi:bifunctional N(6)-L-threonylcarbamoyladenine synthase/serine/threonine protein kinase [Haloarchaeobius sp. HME9146]|uniref:bifunctional N(6)-L-threonylcarbamoyladenine synthase/serine/threonine protein kinase n=1 Tax=Haloarchaeobius sp. HME9146 TaxID=2978732 RepID=UPI0021C171CA|nr:bifunctional N(6)-L-threonylcarbamoyladenine synthase/serine/threonine protein kinase [Haloarchaeobius sp. HME9146]MCT9094484.1 bifunctional N(6)-L-threonylcarbamoyladenine synthase/serine/threonine protein kinase [Haloarchaeobius sp. HME9146]
MRVLGIEGTAWCASAALYDTGAADDADAIFIESDAYQPESGGIHPREAAEHMHEAIPEVVGTVLEEADGDIDAVAFSQGPGLGPCLRTVGTAARALAQTLDVPLVGVNHMVAHLEIGRQQSGFDSPVCLNASGANAHLLGYRNGRYRVLGETMDTGVGNAIDKFTRHVGWAHPGGPKVEQHAQDGEFCDLPYVVKGMDFSFSGIMSAAKQAYDDGVPVEDVCFSLQEHIFGMLTEVSERALSLTGSDELVLGGGVGQNARLREMLESMCEERGAEFYAPEPRFLRDNAGMIAVLGAKMARAGDTLPIDDSAVDPNFRPDEVPVTWRGADEDVHVSPEAGVTVRGAEAIVEFEDDRVVKRRVPKAYRHAELDDNLRRDRTVLEARLTSQARRVGVPTPVVRDLDPAESTIVFEFVGESDLREAPTEAAVRDVGRHLAAIHDSGFVHGDPTTRNVRVGSRTYLIDFGLGYHTDHAEDYAMDLHVFDQSLVGTADDPEPLREAVRDAYRDASEQADAVLGRLATVEGRGRYQSG